MWNESGDEHKFFDWLYTGMSTGWHSLGRISHVLANPVYQFCDLVIY
jgi:hypothetical protein